MPPAQQISAPAFGAWLKGAREHAELSQGEAVIRLRKTLEGLQLEIPVSNLTKFERHGRIPHWPMLLALCALYKRPIMEAVIVIIDGLVFPGVERVRDQICQSGTGISGDAAVAARLLEAESERDRYKARLDAAERIAGDLFDLLVAPKTTGARTRTTGRPRGVKPTD